MTFIVFVLIIWFLFYQNRRISNLEKIIQGKHVTQRAEPVAASEVVREPVVQKTAEEIFEDKKAGEISSGKLIGVVGIVAVVIGASFFLKYAFQNNWIQPLEIILIGILFGITMIFVGQWLRKKYLGYSDLLMGGGLSVCYLSVFASYGFYHLVGAGAAFSAMMFITVVGAVLSILNSTSTLSVLTFIGGFISPLLFSLDVFSEVWTLYFYITILNVGIFAISYFKKWSSLVFVGLVGTFILFATSINWQVNIVNYNVVATSVIFLTIQYLVILASGLLKLVLEKVKTTQGDHVLLPASALAFIAMFGIVLMPQYENQFCLVLVAFSALYLVLSVIINKQHPEDRVLNIMLPGLATLFFTAAIPIKFSGSVVATVWLVESVILYLIASRVSSRGFQIMGAILYALGLFSTFFYLVDYEISEKFSIVFNSYFGMLALAVLVSYAIAFVYYKFGSITEDIQRTGIIWFVVLANILSLYALTNEVHTYYELFGLSKGRDLVNISNVSVSILWALYAVALTLIGFIQKYVIVRRMGLVLFMITAFKVLISDVWNLGDIYRIVSFLGFGLICLSASYLYVKFKDRL